MEEKKIESKEVKLNPKGNEQTGKLTYEELNKACAELSQQNQQMRGYIQKTQQQMQQMEFMLQSKRLDYMFWVLKYEDVIKDPDFVNACVQEIKEALTAPTEEATEEGK